MVELEECCSGTGDSSVSSASTVQGNQKFSLLKWFKRSSKSLPYNQNEKLPNETNNFFSSCDSISTFYSTTTVRSFDFQTGIDTLNNDTEEKIFIDLNNQNSKKIGPFGVGAVKIISKNGVNNNNNNGNSLSVTQTLPANALSRGRDITARYSLQNCTVSFGSCDNLSGNNSSKRESAKLLATRGCASGGSNVKRVHVRGKRKAPSPPIIAIRPKSICEENRTREIHSNVATGSSITWRKKKKRPAPKTPTDDACFNKKSLSKIAIVKDSENNQEIKINNSEKQIVERNNFGNEKIDDIENLKVNTKLEEFKRDRDENFEKENLKIEEINRDSDEFECENSWEENSSVRRISNDTLILQGGKLHSKNDPGLTATLPIHKKYNKLSTAMPRPWYKRSVFEQKDDSQIPTTSKNSTNESGSLRNFFNKSFDKNNSYDKKKDTKRKSGLSILMNISELDKEAAAIVQEEQARSRAAMLLQSSRFDNVEKRLNDNEGVVQEIVTSAMENSPRKGTRALISKFNAIGNITRVNVNTNFFGRKDSNRSELRETEWKRKQETSEVSRVNKDLSRYFPRRPEEELSQQDNNKNKELQLNNESIQSPISSPKFNQKFITARSQFLNEFKLKNTPSPPSISRRLSSNKDEKLHQDAPGCSSSSSSSSDKTFINSNSPKLLRVKVMEHRNMTSEKLNIENGSSCDTIQREFSNIFEEIDKQLTPPRNTVTDKKLKYFSSPSNKVGKVLDILVQAEQNERKNDKVQSTLSNNNKDNVKDLKEMLKEMKYSLPKRPKQKKIDESRDKINSEMSSNNNLTNHVKITGPPIVHIGPKKFNYQSTDSKKVSSSVQTSGNVRKIDKLNVKNLPNDFIRPVTNDLSSASSSSSSSTIGKKFHLMRPREFAAIEAIITTENNHDDDNTYENVIEKSIYANSIVLPSRNHRIIPVPEIPKNAWGKEKYPEPVEVQVSRSSFTNTVDENPVTMEQKMNTLAVNRLLKRLEAAIASGNHQQAAGLAKDLAKLKIQCSVVRQKTKENNIFNVDMYIEDRLAHQGPIPLQLELTMTIAQLKNKIFHEFQIPKNVQRWIIGRRLADNDDTTLEELEIIEGLPVFLYLIAPVFQIGEDKNIKNLTISTNNITKKITTLNKIKINDSSIMKIEEKKIDNNERNERNKIEENKQNKIEGDKQNKVDNDVEKNLKNTDRQEQINVKVKIQSKVDNINDKVVVNENNATDNEKKKDKEEKKNEEKEEKKEKKKKEDAVGLVEKIQMEQYNELIMLENCGLVPNTNSIECPICFMIYDPGEGVILRDCLHTFCRTCIESTIRYCGEAEVKCPYMDSEYTCESTLQEREIKALVDSQVYEKHLAKSVSQAENNAGHHAFHCKTPDCPGWCFYDDNVNNFLCPVCDKTNCLTCRVIHDGKNCWEYQEDVKLSKETDEESKRTATMLAEMLERGEAMTCPTCDVVLMKKWGCDWLRCSMCKTEICWVTRGPRWGPLGKGDTSGGCKCGENGVKCHPRCNYCH